MVHFPQTFFSEHEIEDITEAVLSTSTSKAASDDKSIPPAKVPHQFDELIDLEKEIVVIKRQNLLLKHEKLKLQIGMLKRNFGSSETVQHADKLFFNV